MKESHMMNRHSYMRFSNLGYRNTVCHHRSRTCVIRTLSRGENASLLDIRITFLKPVARTSANR